MRALRLMTPDGLDGLKLADVPPPPPPTPGEVTIAVQMVGVNRLDLAVMHGKGPGTTTYPQVIGSDPSGVVLAVGDDVTALEVGQQVVVKPNVACWECRQCEAGHIDSCLAQRIVGVDLPGGAAEQVNVRARNVSPIPPGLDFTTATAAVHSFPIALQMLRERGRLQAGEVVVVVGAAGAVGSAAVKLARQIGAVPFGVVGSPDKVAAARQAGCRDVVVADDAKALADRLRDAGADDVDMLVDTAGDGSKVQAVFPLLARRARVLVCGAHAGSTWQVSPMWLYRTRAELIGSSSPSWEAFVDGLAMAGRDPAGPLVHGAYDLADHRQAYELLVQRRNRGKVLLRVS